MVNATRRLILLGGGHAHIAVLRSAAQRRFDGELVLVSPNAQQLYSGMMPAQLRGVVGERALSIDLGALCRAAGAQFVESSATNMSVTRSHAHVQTDTTSIDGDWCSVDIGAIPTGHALPGVREHAYATRPLNAWHSLLQRVNEVLTTSDDDVPLSCCVVGGGAAGCELAFALLARADMLGRAMSLTILSAAPRLLPDFSTRMSRCITALLETRGVRVKTGATVASVTAHHVQLADGQHIDSALTLWLTGADAPPLLRASACTTDAAGFLLVDATLRAVNGDALWGAGDCVSHVVSPWVTKSGVYAVRSGAVLAHNLRCVTSGAVNRIRTFTPQHHTMFILDSADGRAVLHWRGILSYSRWAWLLKRVIDRRFVARYNNV